MRQSHPEESLTRLCSLFGFTRPAYYEAQIQERKTGIAHMVVLMLFKKIRIDIPIIGTKKLLFLLNPQLQEQGIKMGRDQLFDLLRFYGQLMRRRRRNTKTTDSHHWLKRFPRTVIHDI